MGGLRSLILTHGVACTIAITLLYQSTLSSCCERNWSTYENLQTLRKNWFELSKVETLVYVHTKLSYIQGKGRRKMWDVFHLELKDPVLEPTTFDDGDHLKGSSSTPMAMASPVEWLILMILITRYMRTSYRL